MFVFIFALALDAQGLGCDRVALVTNYDRARVTLQAFLASGKKHGYEETPKILEVLTPEEASGSNVDASIVLGGHLRNIGENTWHGGHQAQAKRPYMATSRASILLNDLVEGPRHGTRNTRFANYS